MQDTRIQTLINTKQETLRLFITIIALVCICISAADFFFGFRLNGVTAHVVLVSPYFQLAVIFCGYALYAACVYTKYARVWAVVTIVVMSLASLAPQWSDAWVNGRLALANSITALVFFGAAAAMLLRPVAIRNYLPLTKGAFVVAVFGVAATTLTSYALIESHIATRQKFATASARVVASNIKDRVEHTAAIMQRIAERLSIIKAYSGNNSISLHSVVEHELKVHIRDFSFIKELAVIDANQSVVWESSAVNHSSKWIQTLVADHELQGWLQEVRGRGRTHIAPVGHNLGGSSMEIMVSPFASYSKQGWFVVAAIDLASLLAQASSRGEDFGYFRIADAGRILYETAGKPVTASFAAGDISIPIHGDITLQLSYIYADKHSDLGGDILPEFVLLAGVIFTFFLLLVRGLRILHVSAQYSYAIAHCMIL